MRIELVSESHSPLSATRIEAEEQTETVCERSPSPGVEENPHRTTSFPITLAP